MFKYNSILWSTLLVAGLITGICCNLIMISLIIVLATVATFLQKTSPKQLVLISLSAISGHYLYQQKINLHHQFNSQLQNQVITITGILTDYTKVNNAYLKHRLTIKIQAIEPTNLPTCLKHSIWVYTRSNPKILIGQQIKLSNLKFKAVPNGQFQEHLLKNGISTSIFVPELQIEVTSKIQDCLGIANQYKLNLNKSLIKKMSPQTAAAFSSIFLGQKQIYPYEQANIKNNFQIWGVVHYLARAGLHLILIAMIWQMFANFWQLPLWACQTLIMLLMLLFHFLSTSAIPFIRALITLLLNRACQLLKLQIHILHILNLSCLIILITDPATLFFLDFQLSFGLTYGLVFLNQIKFYCF